MKLKLNDTYNNAFITLHNGLILKKDEDWKEYNGNMNTELAQYIHQKYIIVKDEETVKVEEEPKVEEKPKVITQPKIVKEVKVEEKKEISKAETLKSEVKN